MDFNELDAAGQVEHTWTGCTVLESASTARGTHVDMVYIPALKGIACFMNGRIQSAQSDESEYHDALVEYIPPSGLSVCVFGGGEGATAKHLFHNGQALGVDMFEWDKEVVEMFHKPEYVSWPGEVWSNPELHIEYEDAFKICKEVRDPYDWVVVDLFDMSMCELGKWRRFIHRVAKWTKWGLSAYIGVGEEANRISRKITNTLIRIGFSKIDIYDRYIPSFRGYAWFVSARFS